MKTHRLIILPAFLLSASLVLTGCRFASGGQPSHPATQVERQTPTAAPSPTPVIEALTFQTGRNDYTVRVDDTPREFIVYVPAGYDPNQPTPVVFMFHGSNQGGQLMYENTKWAGKADEENFIVVFPTSWKYPLVGETGTHTKWNDPTLYLIAEPGTELKDDVKFVQTMLARIAATFPVDKQRLFATGFSNGGSFVSSSLLFQMHDTFAAFAICGSGIKLGSEQLSENMPDSFVASMYSIVGTEDEKISEGTGHARPFPMKAEDILNDELFGPMLKNTATILSLDPTQYEVESQNAATKLLFNQNTAGADNEYIFLMVNNMGHVYPSVDNNRYGLNAADLFWEFFLKHPLK